MATLSRLPIQSLKKSKGSLKIVIQEKLPAGFYCPSLPQVTYPAIMIRTHRLEKKFLKNAEFVVEQEINDCQPREDTVVVDRLDPNEWPRDPFAPEDASIKKDVLSLKLSHGGGCAHHTFQLVASGAFLESGPAQADILLAHSGNNDLCEGLVTRELLFDLTPLKIAYQRAYQVTSGVLLLRLHGSDLILRYEFDS
jgi:hypothetical protein